MSYPYARFTGRFAVSSRLFVGTCVIVLACVATPAFGDGPPTLVKIRLRGGRAVVGELIEQSPDSLKVRNLKSGREAAYSTDDLLKVERDIGDSDAIASAGLPAFVAWKLSRDQTGSGSGKIADVKPTAIYVTIGTKAGAEKGQKLIVYRDEGEIKDPDTGEVLERQRAKIAELEITEAREKFSKAKLRGDLEVQLRAGDEVETDQNSKAIAVLPPVDEDGNRTTGGEKLAEELTTALVTHCVKTVERTLLEKALGELELQQEGLFDEAIARNVGKQLGAYAIMTGRVVQTGRVIDVHVRLIKVDTGEILLAASQKRTGDLGDVVGDSVSPKPASSGDLLRRIDLAIHGHSSNINASGKSVIVGPQSALSIPPFAASGDYELEIGFIRTSGSDALVGALPIGKGQFNFGLSGEYGKQHAVMGAAHEPGKLQNGIRYSLRLRVKHKSGSGDVEMLLDGQSLIKTQFAISPADRDWAGIQPAWIPAIKSQNATYEIQSIALKHLR
jgi:TolB-like protein